MKIVKRKYISHYYVTPYLRFPPLKRNHRFLAIMNKVITFATNFFLRIDVPPFDLFLSHKTSPVYLEVFLSISYFAEITALSPEG